MHEAVFAGVVLQQNYRVKYRFPCTERGAINKKTTGEVPVGGKN